MPPQKHLNWYLTNQKRNSLVKLTLNYHTWLSCSVFPLHLLAATLTLWWCHSVRPLPLIHFVQWKGFTGYHLHPMQDFYYEGEGNIEVIL